jgi:hypothetical protein
VEAVQTVTFAGPEVATVLGQAGIAFDEATRSVNRTRYVVMSARYGYVARWVKQVSRLTVGRAAEVN